MKCGTQKHQAGRKQQHSQRARRLKMSQLTVLDRQTDTSVRAMKSTLWSTESP